MQLQVDIAEELAVKLRVCMGRDDSIIYEGTAMVSGLGTSPIIKL